MVRRKISTGVIIAIAATGLFLTLLTTGLLMSYQTVTSQGTITTVNVGVYSDSECTQNLTSINWLTLRPSDTANRTIYVKNNGTVPITLTMTTENWLPTNASALLTLTWNQQNTVLNATKSIPAILTLSVASSTGNLTDFSFNIIITGTES